jgi:Holliday junction DNA helicase RuvA
MILSALSAQELCNVISSGNEKLLKSVKGIGLKTAQRIIVDLKDKIASTGIETVAAANATLTAANNEVYEEAVAALTMLGFAPAPSQKVAAAILKEGASLPVERVIKEALKRL